MNGKFVADRSGSRGPAPTLRGLALALAIAAVIALPVALRAAGTTAPAATSSKPATAPAALPGSDDCAMCHAQGPVRGTKPGDPPPFDAASLRGSTHAGVPCTGCHADLAGKEFPHARPAAVACASCHASEAKQYAESLHGRAAAHGERLAPGCKDCHGTHGVLPAKDPRAATTTANVPALCGRCHHEGSPVQLAYHIPQDSILTNYSESIHGEGLYRKGLLTTAVCTSCHTAHDQLPHTDPRSSIARANVAKTCMQCHVRIEAVHRKVINGALWERQPNSIPACVDCHQPHRVRKVYYTQGMADRDCLSCHARADMAGKKGTLGGSLHVDATELAGSRHARVACAQCHSEVQPSETRPCRTITKPVDCSVCHAEVVDTYRRSTHGKLAARQSPDAPSCRDCHGTHGIRGHNEPESKTYASHVPELCGQCHRSGHKAAARYKGPEKNIVEGYVESIHGKGLLESGLTVTATCVDCHTAHGELPHQDPASSVNPDNVAKTCAQCHRGIYELFVKSIHSPAVSHSKQRLPTCADCHTAHTIGRTDRANFRLDIMNTCGRCHGQLAASYFQTYHGKVSKLGYAKTAKCYDCHGAHDILPVWNPQSHLSRANIVQTCARCHPGSNRRFAGYLTHATHHEPHRYPALFWAFWGMTGLLIGTFAFAGAHTIAWLPRSLQFRRALLQEEAIAAAQHVQPIYVRRFPALYRNLHLMVIVSFLLLALSGMTLKFSYTPWAWVLARMLGGFEAAGMIHRVAAVITFTYFGTHVFDVLRRQRASGRSWRTFITGPEGMVPGWTDLKEFWQSVKWFVGRGPRPKYGRWTYWEKFDYFAVFWGVAIIGTTGLLLWFPTVFTKVLPGWLINVATIVHSDEALLAVGFIFTVHFFNTHFRPEKFPIDPVIFVGGMPLEEFKRDRPREYEQLVASGQLERRLMVPPSPAALRAWRTFGFTALGIGLALVVLIVYAAVWGYR